jgi:hypothetical protein
MGVFDNIEMAKASRGGNYERAGRYYEYVRRVKLDTNRKKIEFIAVEKVILHVIAADPAAEPHSVGEQVTHLLMSDKDSFLGNVKSMIAGLFNEDPDAVTAADAEMVVSDQQPAAGLVIEVNNRVITTKAEKPFTLVNYTRSLTPEEVFQLIPRENLDKALLPAEVEALLAAVREG